MKQNFNIVIVGTGGQGLITLLQLIAEAAMSSGLDVKTSELHGLSQRGGSVEVHIRFGEKIYSPMVAQGKADLIIALEMQEALKAAHFASPKTTFLITRHIVPILLQKPFSEAQVLGILKKITKKARVIPAAEICKKELGTIVVAGIYLLSLASFKNLIPLKPALIFKTIERVIPPKYLELNKKTFALAKKHEKD